MLRNYEMRRFKKGWYRVDWEDIKPGDEITRSYFYGQKHGGIVEHIGNTYAAVNVGGGVDLYQRYASCDRSTYIYYRLELRYE
jgi:hypothetical protein